MMSCIWRGLRNDQFRAPGQGENISGPAANSRLEPLLGGGVEARSGDVRVNTAMGIECIRGGRFEDAEKYLRVAVARATDRYTTPKDGEPLYYLAMALKMQGKTDEAFDRFSKATWSGEWKGPAYVGMAEIASLREDSVGALSYLDQALVSNSQNTHALALKAALLRDAGRKQDAEAVVEAIKTIDPLDVHAAVEDWMLRGRSLAGTVDAFPNTGLEVATDDMNAGLWADAAAVLSETVTRTPEGSNVSPLAFYDLGYCAQQMGLPEKAKEYFGYAAKASPDYVFPFQMESIAVLKAAMVANPKDSRAPYYLGNLLYDSQPEEAVGFWEQSAALGADFPVVYHNLALAYTRQAKADMRDKALAWLEKAASLGGNAQVFNELDKLYEENGVSPEARLSMMNEHQAVINRDETIAREINLDIFAGHYDAAIGLLESRLFRAWEGGASYSVGDSWVNAHILKGRQALLAGDAKVALASFEAASQFPASMQSATGNAGTTRAVEISYWIGNAEETLGDTAKAQAAWSVAAKGTPAQPVVGGRGPGGGFRNRTSMGGQGAGVHVAQSELFYQGLAMRKLGQTDDAKKLFHQLVDAGTAALKTAPAVDFKAVETAADRGRTADAHYLAALGEIGLDDSKAAREELTLALQASPDHLAAKTTLAAITK